MKFALCRCQETVQPPTHPSPPTEIAQLRPDILGAACLRQQRNISGLRGSAE